ncbi:MAG: FtsX-like permease family protein [Bacilli bacterium]
MIAQLALRNVKRCFKEYGVYFLTLTLSVVIFYAFNSIEAQQSMLILTKMESILLQTFHGIVGYVSVVVSMIVAGLVLYANFFVLKRRKKEFGLYLLLGMGKRKVISMLIIEFFIVFISALCTGLLFGVGISQCMGYITAGLFEVQMSEFQFVFSTDALLRTVAFIGSIFLVVLLFSVLQISTLKLIDLLSANVKNEIVVAKRGWRGVLLLMFGIGLLIFGYNEALEFGFTQLNALLRAITAGVAGTVFFFLGCSSLFHTIAEKVPTLSNRGTTIFLLRQFTSKSNSTFLMMSVVCLMLFFTIGVLSTGLSTKTAQEKEFNRQMRYDMSFVQTTSKNNALQTFLEKNKVKEIVDAVDKIEFSLYETNIKIGTILQMKKEDRGYEDMEIAFVTNSDFQKVQSFLGTRIHLKSNEVLFTSQFDEVLTVIDEFVRKNKEVSLLGEKYVVKNKVSEEVSWSNSYSTFNHFTIVVPDHMIKEFYNRKDVVNIKIGSLSEGESTQIENAYANLKDNSLTLGSRNLQYRLILGSSTIVLYIGIYLGVVSLLSGAAILALQQLTGMADNVGRYIILHRMGATQRKIEKTLYREVAIQFSLPLVLALVHSYFGITVVNETLLITGRDSVLMPALYTTLILLVVYGGYFWLTYQGSKQILRRNE